MLYNKILVPLDGSQFSECSLPQARDIAQGCQAAETILLRVVEPLPAQAAAAYAEAGGDWLAKAEALNRDDADSYMANLSRRLTEEGWPVRAMLAFGRAADEIISYAEKNGVDLIIMTTHGRSGISRWAFGSVTDRVVRYSRVPVLTIAPPGCRLPG
jgi:nucleotide-binding universal stress UspA family protein